MSIIINICLKNYTFQEEACVLYDAQPQWTELYLQSTCSSLVKVYKLQWISY